MKSLSLLSLALVPVVVKAEDNANCRACQSSQKSFCYYSGYDGGDLVLSVCVDKATTTDAGCPTFASLGAMYKSIDPTNANLKGKIVAYAAGAGMDCSVGLMDVALTMTADATKEKMDKTFEDCMTADLAWCNYEPKGKQPGGYCGADASLNCAKLADFQTVFEPVELTQSNGRKAVKANGCSKCGTDDFCSYSNDKSVAYAVCLPATNPVRTTCPVLTSMNEMYVSLGVDADKLTSELVAGSKPSKCGKFNELSQLLMKVNTQIVNDVFEKMTCADCVKAKNNANWCNYVPTKDKATGDEKEGGYCGATDTCVELADVGDYTLKTANPVHECTTPSGPTPASPSGSYPTAVVSTSICVATALMSFLWM